MYRALKNFLVGEPLASSHRVHEKLPRWKALAIYASDALSSVAYGTDAVLIPLVAISIAATSWSLPIAIGIACLLLVLSVSYWQTIRAYPKGGGAYVVAKANLGVYPALITAAALLVDYILTVSVSVVAGVAAITSAMPFLYDFRVVLACFFITLITLTHLRGFRETGKTTWFSIPTYLFLVSLAALILTGFSKLALGSLVARAPLIHEVYPDISLFLVLYAFSSGCAALAGIEATAGNVPSFRPPEPRNAKITLAWVAILLGGFFLGVTALSHSLSILPSARETMISQLGRTVFGDGFLYYLLQLSTALILYMAANTSFSDFPRVCSLLAQDRFLPRQFASLGDRLVFSNGILILGFLAICLVIFANGVTYFLIPLYAVGVFFSFSTSQSGMVRYHLKHREKGWMGALVINGVGAGVSFVVLLVIAATKFSHGAWLILVLIPALVIWFRITREHYRKASVQLALSGEADFMKPIKHVVVLPLSGIHNGVVNAIRYAKSISQDVRAVYVELDEAQTERLQVNWAKLETGVELVVLKSPFRSVIGPIVKYIRDVDSESPTDMLTVVVPEFVTARWWENIYHNQTALMIRTALMFERGKVVTTVRHHLSR
ncbi:MAG: APC family permease [Deltaproteobacteria bacterium]|nr:APC family permease [Deltaproteobacteria bacterium]